MEQIQDFLHSTSEKLGVTEETTRSATGGLLQMIQQQAGEDTYSKLLAKMPGAGELVGEAPAAPESGGGAAGLLGGIGSKAAGALGGKLGAAAGAMELFKRTGLDAGQAQNFVSMFFDFAKGRAGTAVVGEILGKLPELKRFLG